MNTYLIGGPAHGTVTEADGRTDLYATDWSGTITACPEMFPSPLAVTRYRPFEMFDARHGFMWLHVSDAMISDWGSCPNVDWDRMLDEAHSMLQTSFHNSRAGRV